MTMTLTLRPAVADDLTAVGFLHHRSRVAAYSGFIPAEALAALSRESLAKWWNERWQYERQTHLMTLAERGGELVGFTYLGPIPDEPGVGMLNAIHLEPQQVGTGVGRALMVHALSTMRARSWTSAALWVFAENERARHFYERGGWHLDGQEHLDDVGGFPARKVRYVRPIRPLPSSLVPIEPERSVSVLPELGPDRA